MSNVRQEIINAIRFSPVYQTEMATMCSLSVGTIRRIARGEMFTLSDGLLELLDALGYRLILEKKDEYIPNDYGDDFSRNADY